jgi:hypothetical protein
MKGSSNYGLGLELSGILYMSLFVSSTLGESKR